MVSLLSVPLAFPTPAFAAACSGPSANLPQTIDVSVSSITINISNLDPTDSYNVGIPATHTLTFPVTKSGGSGTVTVTDSRVMTIGNHNVFLINASKSTSCDLGTYTVVTSITCDLEVTTNSTVPGCVDDATIFTVNVKNAKDGSGNPFSGSLEYWNGVSATATSITITNGNAIRTDGPYPADSTKHYVFQVGEGGLTNWKYYCKSSKSFTIIDSCATYTPGAGGGAPIEPYDPLCDPADPNSGIKTALGCIPVSAQAFTDVIMPWAIGLGAGIAFLLGIYGAFLIATASGDPEKVQAGKELITSAVAGILLIIFTVILLTVIGVDILGLFSF